MLYKLENGYPKPFRGKYIRMDGKIYANPTEEQIRKAGYKELVKNDMPEKEGYYYTDTYDDTGDEIIQSWEGHEIREEEENNGEAV